MVSLPAGTFTTTGVTIPRGVSLRGAGYGLTTLQVTGQVGITVDGGAQTTLNDFTVSGAVNAGILVSQANHIDLSDSKVMVTECKIPLTRTPMRTTKKPFPPAAAAAPSGSA